jgi:predicted nucleic acid-binding protein
VIVLDASVLIGQLERTDAHHEDAARRLAQAGGHGLGASTITLSEVLVGAVLAERLELVQEALGILGVTEMPLPTDAALRLAVLRAETGLRLPDCCVLLAAQETGMEGVITFDDRLAAAARRLGLPVR